MNSSWNLEHLDEDVAKIALCDDKVRVAYIRKDRFVMHRQASEILDELEMLYQLDDAVRPQGRLLTGYSLMGKSTLVEEFLLRHPANDNVPGDAALVPVVRVQYPESTRGSLYGEILGTLNGEKPRKSSVQDMRLLAVNLLRDVGMRILLIDEFHNILEGSALTQRAAVNSVKYLMNELRRPVVVIGTEDVITATRTDKQIESRLHFLPLRRFDFNDDFLDLLAGFEVLLPLRKPSNLDDPKLGALIYKHAHGVTGNVADLLNKAAIMAIETGTEQITEDEINAFKDNFLGSTILDKIEELLG